MPSVLLSSGGASRSSSVCQNITKYRSPQQAAGLLGTFIKPTQLDILGVSLVPDRPADDLCSDRLPDGPHKRAVLPELTSPALATSSRETRKECAGGEAFEDVDHPGGGVPWRCGEQPMARVFPPLHRIHLPILGCRNLVKEVLD